MGDILKKLNQLGELGFKNVWKNWTLEEIKRLLEIYLLISEKEAHIFDLIYNNHECDSWEHIFRDYNTNYLESKANGVKVAIQSIDEQMAKKEA
jgi:hypothetical protein